MRVNLLLIASFAICANFLFVSHASAKLTVCNKTGYPVVLAVAQKNGDDWVSQGWWHISGGHCAEVVSEDLNTHYLLFYYAEQQGHTYRWDGDSEFCVSQNSFTIVGADAKDCEKRGYVRKGFRFVNIGKSTSYELSLIDK